MPEPMIRSVFLLLAFSLAAHAAGAAEPGGPARALDGDTLEIAGEKIRLRGIDAPEIGQTCRTRKGRDQQCGELARQALAAIVENQTVACKGGRRDPDGAIVAVCRIGWLDVGEKMVLDGWALADPQDGKTYARAESFAKARREGLWRSEFVAPWEWRRR